MLFFIKQKLLALQSLCCFQGWTGAQRCKQWWALHTRWEGQASSPSFSQRNSMHPKAQTEQPHQGFRTHQSPGPSGQLWTWISERELWFPKQKGGSMEGWWMTGKKIMGAKLWKVDKTMWLLTSLSKRKVKSNEICAHVQLLNIQGLSSHF